MGKVAFPHPGLFARLFLLGFRYFYCWCYFYSAKNNAQAVPGFKVLCFQWFAVLPARVLSASSPHLLHKFASTVTFFLFGNTSGGTPWRMRGQERVGVSSSSGRSSCGQGAGLAVGGGELLVWAGGRRAETEPRALQEYPLWPAEERAVALSSLCAVRSGGSQRAVAVRLRLVRLRGMPRRWRRSHRHLRDTPSFLASSVSLMESWCSSTKRWK